LRLLFAVVASNADIPVFKMQSVAQLAAGVRIAAESGARRYSMVCSRHGPTAGDVTHLAEACDRIRGEFPRTLLFVERSS